MNIRAALASCIVGMGQTTLITFCGMITFSPPNCSGASSCIINMMLKVSNKTVRENKIASLVEFHD